MRRPWNQQRKLCLDWMAVAGLISAASALAGDATTVPATTQSTSVSAAEVYRAAAQRCVELGPSNANDFDIDKDPLFSAKWISVAAEAYRANADARAMVQAVPAPPAGCWMTVSSVHRPPLNETRAMAQEFGDAAIYALLQDRPNETLDLLDTIDVISQILRSQPATEHGLIRLLVAVGIDAIRDDRLLAVAPRLKIADTAAPDTVRPARVRALINGLLRQQQSVQDQIDPVISRLTPAQAKPLLDDPRFVETIKRRNAERTFAAMSLACQLYYADQGTWPEQAADLVPVYLPSLPIDPWGDGKQTFGYQLVPNGRPDGADRPLLSSRCQSKDGMAFTTTRPIYSFQIDDGGSEHTGPNRQLGQFRDVSAWERVAKP